MTTIAISLRDRAIAAAAEAGAQVAAQMAADERERIQKEVKRLADRMRESLGVTSMEISEQPGIHEGFYEVHATVDGLTFSINNGIYEEQLCVRVECHKGCGKPLWIAIDDVEDLGRVLSAKNSHSWECVKPAAPMSEGDVATLNARLSIERLGDVAQRVAAAMNRVAQLEDERALIKPQAIRRLIESGAATSATAAERIVEQDDQYAAHRLLQRDAEIDKWAALGAWEAMKLDAQLDVAIAANAMRGAE